MFSSPPDVDMSLSAHVSKARVKPAPSTIPSSIRNQRARSVQQIPVEESIAEEIEPSGLDPDNSIIQVHSSSKEDLHNLSREENVPTLAEQNTSLVLATPAVHRTPPRARDILQAALNSSVAFHLSPLPSFTVHQADEPHDIDIEYVPRRQGLLSFNQVNGRFSLAVERLVGKLTDVEPNEPYWEHIRKLGLANKDILTLHMLDEFCPRMEELDVNNNELAQINGVPASLRTLSIRQNCLTSLTAWGHLQNLQYLDVSGNKIESLKAFAPLIQLRELIAEDNQIESLKGIFGLNGLLKLKLARNSIEELILDGSNLFVSSSTKTETSLIWRVVPDLLSLIVTKIESSKYRALIRCQLWSG